MNCPYCNSDDVTEPVRISVSGQYVTVRQCRACFRLFNPDGTKIGDKQYEEIKRHDQLP